MDNMPVNKKGEDKMENAKVSNKKLMSLAILFVSALEMGGMGLQPALADIAAAFPDIPTVWMQEMSNWPGFAMLLGCALSTLLATKVSKKALCQIGVGFVVAYAVLGFTLHSSFIQLMMWQTILGLGFGFLMPTSNGIIAENYAEDERGKLMGIQDLFTNGGGMYLTLIGGVLAAKAWNYTYLAFLYALIPLVLGCIYFPADKPAKASGEKSHLKIAPITWLFGAIIFVFINSYGVMGANISFIITERGMGTAALTGTAMAIFLVGGMFGGLIFSPFEKKLREYVLCCGFIALVIGFLIIYFAQSLVIGSLYGGLRCHPHGRSARHGLLRAVLYPGRRTHQTQRHILPFPLCGVCLHRSGTSRCSGGLHHEEEKNCINRRLQDFLESVITIPPFRAVW